MNSCIRRTTSARHAVDMERVRRRFYCYFGCLSDHIAGLKPALRYAFQLTRDFPLGGKRRRREARVDVRYQREIDGGAKSWIVSLSRYPLEIGNCLWLEQQCVGDPLEFI